MFPNTGMPSKVSVVMCLHNLMQIEIPFSLTRLFQELSCQVWRCSIKTTSQTESNSQVFHHLLWQDKQEAEQEEAPDPARRRSMDRDWLRGHRTSEGLAFRGPRSRWEDSAPRLVWGGQHPCEACWVKLCNCLWLDLKKNRTLIFNQEQDLSVY